MITAWLIGTKCSFKQLVIVIHEYVGFIALVSSVIIAKMGINYLDLEAGSEFWNPGERHGTTLSDCRPGTLRQLTNYYHQLFI